MVKVEAGETAPLLNHVYKHGEVICRHKDLSHPFGIFYGQNPLNFTFPILLIEIILIILISRAIRFLLRPLKQPRIVSDIIGGIFIGPSILGHSKKFTEHVFPESQVFVVKNIGILGFMYFLFVCGVKMDLGVIRKPGRKPLCIAVLGVFVPMILVAVVAVILRNSLNKDLWKVSSIGTISSALAITAFPVLHPILKELNLLSSEVGRMALIMAIIGDVIGMNAVVAFEATLQGEGKKLAALWYVLSMVGIMVFILGGVRRCMEWIVEQTPEGEPVDQIFVIGILVGVMAMGFLTDMFGVAIANGPLWLGLVIPDGPPLGATLVERSETIMNDFLMPCAFAYVGLYTDVHSMRLCWSTLQPLLVMALTGYVTKLVITLMASLYFKMPFKDGLVLSLIMSLRGQVELLLFIHWMDKKIIKIPSFTMMVLLSTMVTAIATPLISILYDPTRPYMISKRRTIQHTATNMELHVVACIHDQECVSGIINLLQVSNPTQSSPLMVYALCLMELVGRAAPVFIDHEKQENSLWDNSTIHNALKIFEETREDLVRIHLFTAVAPQRSMYQDICEMALLKKASLIVLPFHKKSHGGTEVVRPGVQTMNSNVLAQAPCSVGILVGKGPFQNPIVATTLRPLSAHNFAVLFLGGADAREALSYADRMLGTSDVCLTVIRFLSHNSEGDNEMERKLDDGLVTRFWVKNESNDRVVYREVMVRNGEDTVAAIQAMNDSSYDLWIVGRKQGINPVLLEGLSDWSENHELGVVGDYVASMDFGGLASLLVVQQQVLRGQGSSVTTPRSHRFPRGLCS